MVFCYRRQVHLPNCLRIGLEGIPCPFGRVRPVLWVSASSVQASDSKGNYHVASFLIHSLMVPGPGEGVDLRWKQPSVPISWSSNYNTSGAILCDRPPSSQASSIELPLTSSAERDSKVRALQRIATELARSLPQPLASPMHNLLNFPGPSHNENFSGQLILVVEGSRS